MLNKRHDNNRSVAFEFCFNNKFYKGNTSAAREFLNLPTGKPDIGRYVTESHHNDAKKRKK